MIIRNKLYLAGITTAFLCFLTIGCDKDLLDKFINKGKDVVASDSLNLKINMIVIKDCTGSYLRDTSGKFDFQVCNIERLAGYENGTKVEAYFERLKECKSKDTLIVCKMFHENEGWIEVKDIKKY